MAKKKQLSRGQQAAVTRKRRKTAKKAVLTRKRRKTASKGQATKRWRTIQAAAETAKVAINRGRPLEALAAIETIFTECAKSGVRPRKSRAAVILNDNPPKEPTS
jgi:hypothetical protein